MKAVLDQETWSEVEVLYEFSAIVASKLDSDPMISMSSKAALGGESETISDPITMT